MDFESAMQTFAEAWMAANRSGLPVLGKQNSYIGHVFLSLVRYSVMPICGGDNKLKQCENVKYCSSIHSL